MQGTEDRALRGYGHYDRFGRTTSGTERRGHEAKPARRVGLFGGGGVPGFSRIGSPVRLVVWIVSFGFRFEALA